MSRRFRATGLVVLMLWMVATWAACTSSSSANPRQKLICLVNQSASMQHSPQLKREAIARVLSRMTAWFSDADLEVIVVGSIPLAETYSAGAFRSGQAILDDIDKKRLIQQEADVRFGRTTLPVTVERNSPASPVQLDYGYGTNTGQALDRANLFRVPGSTLIVTIPTDGYDEEPNGKADLSSLADVQAALSRLFAAGPTRVVILGPGPELLDGAGGRMVREVWRDMCIESGAVDAKVDPTADDTFIIETNPLALRRWMLQSTVEDKHEAQ